MRLAAFEIRWLIAIAEAILPSGVSQRLPAGAGQVPLEPYLQDVNRRAPALFLLGLRAAIWLAVLYPVVTIGRGRTLLSLPVERRSESLRRMAASPIYVIREMPMLLKMIVCMGFFAVPAIRDSLDVPQEPPRPDWLRNAGGA